MENNKSKQLSIALLVALVGFPQISETIYTPALPNVAEGLHTTAYMVEATLAIYFLGFAFGVILWGTISDVYGRRKAMLTGIFIYAIGTLGCANVATVEALLAWRFLQAFGASVGSVITQTILRDAYSSEERTQLFSVMSGALAFSPALGPVLGGLISDLFNWRANFWVLVILAAVLFIWSFLKLPETRPENIARPSKKDLLQLFMQMVKDQRLWGHILLISATNGILFGFYQEAPFVFIEQLGIRPSYYGLFGLLIAASTIFAARVSYKQSKRLSSQFLIHRGAIYALIGGIFLSLMVISGNFHLNVASFSVITAALFLVFFGVGLIIPNSLSHALKTYQMALGTAGSIFGGMYYCLIALFTWGMSVMHDGTALSLPIYITILAIILTLGSSMVNQIKPVKE